ncbi:MAG TPA: tetratricopeptide repeat protein [Bacteroidia bacterium]|nr:tetratricopeptide repeat protein [Bacteroidia bacterium]HNU33909.1 tetratricopeptide repeat protein [Bacteroidia bacterium]
MYTVNRRVIYYRIVSLFLWLTFVCLFCNDARAQNGEDVLSVFEYWDTQNPFEDLKGKRKGLLKESQAFNERRLKTAEATGNNRAVGIAANNLAIVWLEKGDFEKAIFYAQKSLQAFERINDPRAVAVITGEIGYIYDKLNDDAKALTYYNDALAGLDKIKAPKIVAAIAGNQSIIYFEKSDSVNANKSVLLAGKNFQLANDKTGEGNLHLKLGEIFVQKNNSVKAISSFEKALVLFKEAQNKKLSAIANRNMGIVYFKKGDYEKALQFFEKSIADDKQLLVQKLIKDTYLKIVTVSSFKKDFEKADSYHEKYRNLKSTLADLEKVKKQSSSNLEEEVAQKEKIIFLLSQQNAEQNKILTLQDYELSQQLTATEIERQSKEKALEELSLTSQQKAEKEKQVQLLSKEKALQELELSKKELEIERQNKFRNYLIIAAVFAVLLAFFLYNRYRYKKRSLESVNRAHDQLQEAHSQLKAAQQQLIQSEKMASLGQLTAGIAHEIQNPLNFVNNFSKLSAESIDEFLKSNDAQEKEDIIRDIRVNLEKINHHGKRISDIVKGMLQHSRSDSGEKADTNINALINDAVLLAYHGKRSTELDFNCSIEESFDKNIPSLKIAQQDFRRVILNFANNAFYAVYEKEQQLKQNNLLNGYVPTLNVSTIKQGNNVAVILRDNGTGIPNDIKDKIFNPFFTSKPTGKGTGLGLSISYDIITKIHNGKLTFESEKNKGSTFFITIPIT